eukprot:TRINITY_DN560_c0_g1_i1.p2 TRINITY_DN560_c0_g1~~TRINITY_DN560_c0_g1_i1.p2  ORF type:complete len:117 (+),score=25.98 TRINITY_DN560_c0_g1_i1:31-351(+)
MAYFGAPIGQPYGYNAPYPAAFNYAAPAPGAVLSGVTYYVQPPVPPPVTYVPGPTYAAPVQRQFEYDDFLETYAFQAHPIEQAFLPIKPGKKQASKAPAKQSKRKK